ncbi:MAG: thiamine pyrophosphate-binding protein [Armatimonadota bacterium]
MPRMKASEALVEALAAEGVEYVFGLPGGHSVSIFYDEMGKARQPEAILARHETAGAFAALGYAQLTGKPAVCQGTAGPGFSHMLVGIHEAMYSRIPLVVIAPNAPISEFGKGELQEFHQVENVVQPAKWWYRVDRPEKIPWVIQQAFKHATAPPCGPVFIDIPIDIGDMTAEMPEYTPAPKSTCVADDASIQQAADALVNAKNPVIICGRGIHQSGAHRQVQTLAETLAMPVLVTNHGKTSIPENHPLYGGGVGCNRTVISQTLLEQSDCWLWAGSQIEEFAVGKDWDPLPEGRTFINLNIDPTQFGRNWTPDICLFGDAALTLDRVIEACAEDAGDRNWRDSDAARQVAELRAQHRDNIERLVAETKGPVHFAQFLWELNNLMPEDASVVVGEGANRVWTATQLELKTPHTWVSASDFGCMGYAIGASIGAALARPGKNCFCLTGDGSFQMQMQEIVVAAQYELPITYVVFNNNALGWIKWGQKTGRDERYYATDFRANWNHAEAAQAAGLAGLFVDSPEKCGHAIESALQANESGRPALIEVAVPWDEQTPGFCAHHMGCSMDQGFEEAQKGCILPEE